MRYLYIIPARGGSKGIPGKNIKPLAGKPLLCHSVDHALAAGADPADICLTTDSQQVRRVGEEYGLTVPFLRPAELSTDTAGSREVMLHALDFYEQLRGKYDAIVLLQPTSPLRTAEDIIQARELYTPEIDMVVSVTEAATNPYYNAFETAPDGTLHISKGDGLYTRRQDAPKVWEYNGAVYVINPDSLRCMPMGSF
ncbi:MAG: acylneuraminate cytidylyltransferase family protein, partial [Muribaculaceae bacterium]|nr:acylneuraminate cytidylyltransferase family protein [Muribaculaceae bacterium]